MIFNTKNNIWSLMKIPFKYSPLLAIVTTTQRIIEALFPALNVIIVAQFINTATNIFSGNIQKTAIYQPLSYLIILLAFQLLFGAIVGYFTRKMQVELNNRIGLECIEKQASLAFEYIDNSESFMLIQKIFGEIASNINTIYNDVLSAASLLVRFSSIMLIFIANDLWWIGILIILASFPMISVTYINGRKIYRFYKENFPGQMEMYHSTYILKDRSLTDERTLFGFANVINQKWKSMQLDLYEKKKKVNQRILKNRYIARLINLLCAFIIISFMTYSVFNGKINIGLYIALVTGVISLIDQVIGNAMSWANNLAQEKEFLKDFNIICNYKSNSEVLCFPNKNYISIDTIEFRNVSFVYPGTERKVLDNISFKIDHNIHYAFVGRNGAGKSTIIKLLTGLYDNYSGEILVNGKNLREYPYSDIKAMIGIIYQDYAKYELTLKESIEIGDINTMLQKNNIPRFKQKLNEVGLESLLTKLPKGEDTLLGKTEEEGQDISGGEWQRVAIARLLMKNSNFIILDEPTASLDPIAESNLYQQFSQISSNKTTLLISHRLGSIKIVDHIFVIDDGKIIEEGSHQELLSREGLYYRLYSEQKEWYA